MATGTVASPALNIVPVRHSGGCKVFGNLQMRQMEEAGFNLAWGIFEKGQSHELVLSLAQLKLRCHDHTKI